MKTTKLLTVLTIFILILGLAACGATGGKTNEIATLMAAEPDNIDEAAELYKKLMEKEIKISVRSNGL